MQYIDQSTAPSESDIYEITQTEMICEPEMEDSTFSEVVKFYIDQETGDFFPKYAELGVKKWTDEENFEYIGKKEKINLALYLEQKSVPISLFYKREDIFVKINVILTVRETKSALTASDEVAFDEEAASSEEEQE